MARKRVNVPMAGQNKTDFCNYFLVSITLLPRTGWQIFIHGFNKGVDVFIKASSTGRTRQRSRCSHIFIGNWAARGAQRQCWKLLAGIFSKSPLSSFPARQTPTHDLVSICGCAAELPSPPAAASRRGWHLFRPHSGGCYTDWGGTESTSHPPPPRAEAVLLFLPRSTYPNRAMTPTGLTFFGSVWSVHGAG